MAEEATEQEIKFSRAGSGGHHTASWGGKCFHTNLPVCTPLKYLPQKLTYCRRSCDLTQVNKSHACCYVLHFDHSSPLSGGPGQLFCPGSLRTILHLSRFEISEKLPPSLRNSLETTDPRGILWFPAPFSLRFSWNYLKYIPDVLRDF